MTYCDLCGQNIHLGESYFSLSGSFFHSDCLLDNYTVSDIFKLLNISAHLMSPFDMTDFTEYYILGTYKNVRVTKEFYDYFVKRFGFYQKIIQLLSHFKKEKGIASFDLDQATLERWALSYECQGNFLNWDKPSGCRNDKRK